MSMYRVYSPGYADMILPHVTTVEEATQYIREIGKEWKANVYLFDAEREMAQGKHTVSALVKWKPYSPLIERLRHQEDKLRKSGQTEINAFFTQDNCNYDDWRNVELV